MYNGQGFHMEYSEHDVSGPLARSERPGRERTTSRKYLTTYFRLLQFNVVVWPAIKAGLSFLEQG